MTPIMSNAKKQGEQLRRALGSHWWEGPDGMRAGHVTPSKEQL